MTMQQAAERADAILDATFAAVRPPVPDPPGQSGGDAHHRPAKGDHHGHRRGTARRPPRTGGAALDGSGLHAARATSRDGRAAYFLTLDGFQLSVVGWKDQPHFRVTTPPAEPSEVALPTTPPHGPDYRHKEVPEPDQFDPFWSVPQAPPAER
ncbi:hypothetical protein ABT237_26010 [Streptomyces sp. NPDC001581]|uniref:hypothetical protein n=1 Tax=Streptomyces sp. NPDC001581 TaxID=3154386 RepID=UPI003328A445